MSKIRSVVVFAAMLAFTHVGLTSAISRRDSSDPQVQSREEFRSRLSDRQLEEILTRLRTDAESLRRSLNPGSARGGSTGYRVQDEIFYVIDDLVEAANHLSDHIARRQAVRVDVEDVLRRAVELEEELRRRQSPPQVQNGWTRLRRDLDALASGYGMAWDWRNPRYAPIGSAGGVYQRLTGTYELDPSRSDNPQRAADQAYRQIPANDRARISGQIQSRLDPPDVIAIDRVDNRVTIASSKAPQMTFDADGQPRVEQGVRGRRMTTRAVLYGDQLEVTTTGGAGTDFTVSFEPLENGRSLRVTRRLFDDALRQPIVVQSVYRRTSDTAEWNVYPDRREPDTSTETFESASLVPDGTTVVATLDQPLNVRTAQQDDRVTLTVRNAPLPELEGAVIEGYVMSTPSRTNDRTRLSLDFNEIRLRNGRTSRFAGTIERVRGPNGQSIPFDGETARDESSKKDQAITRGTIGAALGAIIGAVAGGVKGAAIGAVLGGGGAAATVLIDDQNQLDLPRGTEFTIRSRMAGTGE